MTSWLLIPAFLAAGIIGYGYWRGRNPLWVFLLLIFLYLGAGRAGYDLRRWEERKFLAEEISGCYVEAEGRISSLEEENGVLRTVLKDNRVWKWKKGRKDGTTGYKIPGLMVTMKPDAANGAISGKGGAAGLRVGQIVRIRGEAQLFSRARNPGEFDARAYYEALGLDCRLSGKELEFVDCGDSPLLEGLRRTRIWAKRTLYRFAGEEDAGILSAAVLGDKSGISKEIKSLYQKNGIAHLLAISGLHMSLIGLFLFRILRKAGLGYGGAGMAGAVLAVLYGILTGGGSSVVRAVIMMCAGFLASYLGRTYDLLSAASLSLLFLAFKSPLLITQGGVQLSFGAVFAIGGVRPVLEHWLGKEKPFAGIISASIAVQMVTMPIILYHYYQLPVYGIFLNLLVIPLMGAVLCSGTGIIFLGSVSSALGTGAAGTGHYILAFYEFLCRSASGLPGCSLTFGRPGAERIAAYSLVVLAGLVFFKTYGKHNTAAGEPKDGSYALKVFLLTMMYAFCILIFKPGPVKGLEAVFLDVGQGDGILLRTGRSAILVDGGSSSNKSLGEYTLEPCLKSLGVSVIHYSFISHGDQDHLSGVEYLLESCDDIRIENLMLPFHGREDESVKRLAELAKKRGTRVWYLAGGDVVQAEGLPVTCLYPKEEDVPENTNGESEVLKMDYGDCHLLFTGDMGEKEEERLLERPGEKQLLSEVNVLKIAHHGSRYSSSQAFLNAVKPRWAVVSYGEGNSYGHPHKEVLNRFNEQKAEVFQTAECGAIRLYTDGKIIRFTSCVDGEGFTPYNSKK